MELLKSIINLITSFFNRSTVKTQEEVSLAEAKTDATISHIQAASNAAAVEQLEQIQEDLEELHKKQKQEQEDAKANPTDNPFGNSW